MSEMFSKVKLCTPSLFSKVRTFSTDSARKPFALRHIAPGVGRATDLELVSGSGSWVYSSTGKRYLDFACGIGVTNLGHCHPRVVAAIQQQAASLIHAQLNISWHKPMLDLVERLVTVTPSGLDTFFFWNSGSEAVEASVKLARHATKKQNVIVFNGSFHGRTLGTMGLTTSKTVYRAGYGPLLSGIFVAPYPYHYHAQQRYGEAYTEDRCVDDALEDLDILLKTQTAPNETAAMLIEPVLGEGGYVPAPPRFMQSIRDICTKHNILLVVDEVQSGYGRTGRYFSVEHSGVIPDVIVFAKGVASGLPLSGIVSTQQLMSKQPPGSMGGTFAGNAVSCSAAIATLDVLKEENILENVRVRGQQLKEGLLRLKNNYNIIGDVRGLGLMIGLEFKQQQKKSIVSDHFSSKVVKYCMEEGMLLLSCSVFDTIRFIPPLTVSEQEIQLALNIIERVLQRLMSENNIKY